MDSQTASGIPLVIIGLDCAEPSLVFDQFRDRMPVVSQMMDQGSWGKLRSTDPPLTIPAWSAMVTGMNPGNLGCYGIRNRVNYSYDRLQVASSNAIRTPRIWDYAGRHGLQSLIVGTPQTYPVTPVAGALVAGMLAPDTSSVFTWPDNLKHEIKEITPDYAIDVDNFRNISVDQLRSQIWDMTANRFKLFRSLLCRKEWQFAMMVEIGLDRLHHGFWHFWDQTHALYPGNNQYANVIPDYYAFLDKQISGILEILPAETCIFIVSDHGAQPMKGAIRINQWLYRNGYLHFKSPPGNGISLDRDRIDWSKTTAWGEGGYYGRIFLNVQGREPKGIIPGNRYEAVRMDLALKLKKIQAFGNAGITNKIIFPDKYFSEIQGIPPDLMVYFGDLSLRALEGMNDSGIFTLHNDRGPDGANHAQHGIFIANHKSNREQPLEQLDIQDIAPTALNILGIPVPENMTGNVVFSDSDKYLLTKSK